MTGRSIQSLSAKGSERLDLRNFYSPIVLKIELFLFYCIAKGEPHGSPLSLNIGALKSVAALGHADKDDREEDDGAGDENDEDRDGRREVGGLISAQVGGGNLRDVGHAVLYGRHGDGGGRSVSVDGDGGAVGDLEDVCVVAHFVEDDGVEVGR